MHIDIDIFDLYAGKFDVDAVLVIGRGGVRLRGEEFGNMLSNAAQGSQNTGLIGAGCV